jgi:hypothetical protein
MTDESSAVANRRALQFDMQSIQVILLLLQMMPLR